MSDDEWSPDDDAETAPSPAAGETDADGVSDADTTAREVEAEAALDTDATGTDPVAADETAAVTGGAPSTLDRLRGEPRTRMATAILAVVVGVVLGSLHWVGLVVGAALVSLTRETPRRGLAAGVGFGVVVVVTHVAVLAASGSSVVATAVAMRQVFGVGVAVPLVAGLIGGLARSVV
ncbi:hypothetical protein RYH80_13055 [Halobaculum sp. MBLA0147]|uniref:hypothetical protein n=1 Tax=Halobaculum sp. MBLA0147 TaxID=3079934 RepID=UPI003525544C